MSKANSPNASSTPQPARRGLWGEFVYGFLPWILIVVLVRSFVFEPFNIPSGSMIPTLQVGDYIVVSKYSYGYSRFSFPFSPDLFSGRIFEHLPHRGDVAVFRYTKDPSLDYIKRIVGLPGDRIQVREGLLYVNGTLVPRTLLGDYAARDERGMTLSGQLFREDLPASAGGRPVHHDILKLTDDGMQNDTPEYVVPAGHFFAMGDDRDDSADSRFQGDAPDDLGYVPIENLVGQAQFVFFSIGNEHPVWQIWYWPSEIRWSRFAHVVR